MRDIYINSNLNTLAKFPSSGRSTEFKDILPCNISEIITKTVPISTRIVINYTITQSIWFWVWWKVSGHWGNNMIKISQSRESHRRKNTSVRRKIIQKSRTLRITVWDPSRKVNNLSKVVWARNTITELTSCISSTRIGRPVLMMGVKASKDKHNRFVDRKNLSMLQWVTPKSRA